ncbi:MAG: metallophosphoesterase [Clostridiales bacterium]|nr:metallophosphoesterase [Clostridiales bacterium]
MTYCISDIHGEYELLCRLLDKIHFGESDFLFSLGDIVDKGDDSIKTARLLFGLQNVKCIMGNHEHMLIGYFQSLAEKNNNPDTVLNLLQRYVSGDESSPYVSDDGALLDWSMVRAFADLPYFIETAQWIGVHAGVELDAKKRVIPLLRQNKEILLYDRNFREPSCVAIDSKTILFGHTPAFYIGNKPEIIVYPRDGKKGSRRIEDYYKIHIDIGVSQSRTLGCICTDTMETFYVNDERARRSY